MKNRVLIVDATNNFIRNYVVNSAAAADSGLPTGGAVGMLNSLRKCMTDLKPQKIICVWDGPNGSLKRRQMFKEYKAGRKPKLIVGLDFIFDSEEKAKQNKDWQQSVAMEAIEMLPICQIVTDGFEADDAIGFIANNKESFDINSAIILSSDKDYYQLLGLDKVVIYNPIKNKLVSKNNLVEEYKILPENWLLYKCIAGDNSDNVKGVKGIGDKTIHRLFNLKEDIVTLEDIENYPDDGEDSWEKKKMLKLKENMDILKRNWELMSLADPLMSSRQKGFVINELKDFDPSMNVKGLYKKIAKEGLSINLNYSSFFRNLL